MKKVITYGTYDLLHYGHIRLLERAKELGDYLIVGVTGDDFDKTRGKINVQQSLMERVEAVRATGIADEIIIEEYEGQKIDDIKKYDIDIFTVGSDWEGYFDYLKEYCEVVYLDRTQGVSSSKLRSKKRDLRIGIVGDNQLVKKFIKECSYVNGIKVSGVFSDSSEFKRINNVLYYKSYIELLNDCDSVYIVSHPSQHYNQIKTALNMNKNVLCEFPISLETKQYDELLELAKNNDCILFNQIKTAYSTAYRRLLLQLKSGKIGKIVSVDVTCTSLSDVILDDENIIANTWNSMCSWGPTAILPVFQILGCNYKSKNIISKIGNKKFNYDIFTKIDFVYDSAVASVKVGKGVKSEGEMIITGTKGYAYVPAPWWKMDYFELRYENPADNKRFFYQLDGEGIRYSIVSFVKAVEMKNSNSHIDNSISKEIVSVIEDFENKKYICI